MGGGKRSKASRGCDVGRRRGWASVAIACATVLALPALAQTPTQEQILERLQRLEGRQAAQDEKIKSQDAQIKAKDARIDELEAELEKVKAQVKAPVPAATSGAEVVAVQATPIPDAETNPELGEVVAAAPYEKYFGTYGLGTGLRPGAQ